MADFVAPPPGPPPPKVPEGWVARWNEQYKEWFYVNTYTKKSQWEKPTEPAVPPRDESAPAGPPPSYSAGDSKPIVSDTKSNNPYDNPANRAGGNGGGPSSYEDEDARLARQLQAEEDARAAAAANQRAHTPSGQQSPFPSQLPPRPETNDRGGSKGSFLGKIFGAAGKGKHSGSSSHGYGGGGGYPAQGYSPAPYGGSPAPYGQHQQPMYGQQPPVGYGGYPQQGGYGGYAPPQGYYGGGGYPQQQQAYGAPGRSGGGGGMGMMGGAALGLGAGVLGGALIADAVNDHDQEIYQEGYSKFDPDPLCLDGSNINIS
ncbi:hypothetical protein B0T13DRAFT_43668 [Neurospora crassa]|nr:hypothetical protein B0T13DRAFT_43668 [Neurospora crassa]